ncbi:unnamed protein product [Pylaiella littoralis]
MLKTGLGRGEKKGRTRQVSIPSGVPSEGFWADFFSEENFQGKTLGEFLNDATPSPATVKANLSYFDVPHRELFYKEEDLRCFRKDGTYIGDCGYGPDGAAEEAPTQAEGPRLEEPDTNREAEPLSPCRAPSAREAIRGCPEKIVCSEREGGAVVRFSEGRGERDGGDPMEVEAEVEVEVEVGGVGLNFPGAAAFAAASAEYGRSSSLSSLPSSSPSAAAGLAMGGGSLQHQQQQKQQQQQRLGEKRRAGAGGQGLFGTAAGHPAAGPGSGDNPAKRTRTAGGVSASTSSSVGKAVAHAASSSASGVTDGDDMHDIKDPMQKRLVQFRRRKAAGSANAPVNTRGTAAAALRTAPTVVATAAPAAGGRGGRCGSSFRGQTGAASSTSGSVSRTTTRGAAAVKTSAGLRGGSGDVGARDGVFRGGVPAADVKKRAAAATRGEAATAKNVSKIVPNTVPGRSTTTTVSKPVNTVKRSVGGRAGSSAAAGPGGVGGVAAGRRLRSTRENAAGVKRKVPAVLSGNVTDRKRRPDSRKTKLEKDDSAGLSFDDDIKAKLAEHNRGVTKGRHTYEPSKGRVKDWKKWESQTGKKYYSLKPDEKADANREILAMLAAEKEGGK